MKDIHSYKQNNKVKQALDMQNNVWNNRSKGQKCINKLENDAANSNPLATFILDQVCNYSKGTPRWSDITIRQCIAWRFVSPKGYEYARRNNI